MRSTIMGDGGRANERRASFSYWLKTPLSNQTWPRVCSDTNWLWKKEGAFEFCVETLRLADAYENGDKHRKSGGLQKQNHAANARHKARDKQRRKHRQKNSGAASHRRRSVKNKPAKQPFFQSNPQGSNKSAKNGGAPFSLHLLATRSSPNDHKPRHKQDAYCCGSTSFYRSVGLDAVDSKISELFVCSNMIHSNYIRFSAADNFYVHRSRLNQLLLSFSRKGVRIWKKILLSYVISAKTQA